MAGKPFDPIYRLALALAGEALGGPLQRRQVLVVGDGLATDIAGAQGQDLDRLFVATGIHGGEARRPDGGLSAELVDAMLDRAGLSAQFAMGDLAW